MQLNDLAADIAHDAQGEDNHLAPKLAVVFIMLIVDVIQALIAWFESTYVTKPAAAAAFVNYYTNMGPIRRMALAWKIHWEMKKHQDVGVTSDVITSSMVKKFKNLTVDEVLEMMQNQ
jgi:hypothetical protein